MLWKFLTLSLVSLVFAGDEDVLVLTDSNFKDGVAGEDIMLVEFYAPWCGHCKRLAPEYEKAATILKKDEQPVPLAKVDCTEAGKDSCSKYGVSGYPTLKIFRNGELSEDYNGPREADGIVKYMRSRAGPSSTELKDAAHLEKVLQKDDAVCVGFLSDKDSDVKTPFLSTADKMRDEMKFYHTSDKDIIDKYAAVNEVRLYQPKHLHSKFEAKEEKYEGTVTVTKLKEWIKEKKVGLCPHRTSDNAGDLKKPLVIVYYDVDYVKNVKGTNYWRNRVMKVAKKLKEEGKTVQFAISALSDFNHELGEMGIESPDGSKPTVAARNAKDQKFVMSEEFSMDNLEKFANDLLDNKLEAYLKSEPVPDQTEAVKVAVAKNFDEIVADDKDVLIEFYAPWCGHCKSLEPKYKELAEKVQDEPNLVIAKMDATANDVPSEYQVQGFPTIYFKPKGSPPKKYQGGREVSDFISYLKKENPELDISDGKKKKKSKKTEL